MTLLCFAPVRAQFSIPVDASRRSGPSEQSEVHQVHHQRKWPRAIPPGSWVRWWQPWPLEPPRIHQECKRLVRARDTRLHWPCKGNLGTEVEVPQTEPEKGLSINIVFHWLGVTFLRSQNQNCFYSTSTGVTLASVSIRICVYIYTYVYTHNTYIYNIYYIYYILYYYMLGIPYL